MSSIPAAPLGRAGLHVPVMGLGTAPLAGLYSHVTEADALGTIHYALERGVKLIDTAPMYGAGEAERYVGRALQGVSRERYLLSTKVGRMLDPDHGNMVFDYSREGVLRSLEGSLQRLKTDRIDILHIHEPDHHPVQALEEAFPTMDELRRQGVVGAIGAGMNQWQALRKFREHADFDCFLLAGRYTLLEHGALAFLDECHRKGIGILLGGVFNSGILATGAVAGAKYHYLDAHPDILLRTEQIDNICTKYGVRLPAVGAPVCRRAPRRVDIGCGRHFHSRDCAES